MSQCICSKCFSDKIIESIKQSSLLYPEEYSLVIQANAKKDFVCNLCNDYIDQSTSMILIVDCQKNVDPNTQNLIDYYFESIPKAIIKRY